MDFAILQRVFATESVRDDMLKDDAAGAQLVSAAFTVRLSVSTAAPKRRLPYRLRKLRPLLTAQTCHDTNKPTRIPNMKIPVAENPHITAIAIADLLTKVHSVLDAPNLNESKKLIHILSTHSLG